MSLTKVDADVFATQQITLSPSAGSTNSNWADIQGAYAVQVNLKLTGQGSITVGAVVSVEVASADPAGAHVPATFASFRGPLTGSGAITSWSVELPIGVEYFRVTVTHPTYTSTASTLDAEFTKITAIV